MTAKTSKIVIPSSIVTRCHKARDGVADEARAISSSEHGRLMSALEHSFAGLDGLLGWNVTSQMSDRNLGRLDIRRALALHAPDFCAGQVVDRANGRSSH